jgi:hypothetical protein
MNQLEQRPEPSVNENGLETNLQAIVDQICSQNIKPPCSIQLIMDHEIDGSIEFDIIKDFALLTMKRLYGSDVNPTQLSQTDFERLNGYVQSVGYTMKLDRVETEDEIQFKILFDRYKSTKINTLEHLKSYMNKP